MARTKQYFSFRASLEFIADCKRSPGSRSNQRKIFIFGCRTANLILFRAFTNAAIQHEGIGMAEVRYLVTKRNGEWKINFKNLRMGPYPDRIHAIDAAIDMADRDGRNGRDSQVLVRGEDRQFLIEWTYGRDPHPDAAAFD
jgi:hypothetical protein